MTAGWKKARVLNLQSWALNVQCFEMLQRPEDEVESWGAWPCSKPL